MNIGEYIYIYMYGLRSTVKDKGMQFFIVKNFIKRVS